ncbi:hypothetical protein DSECCO2_613970 [anaerobic digester metagenome]
MQVIHVEVIAEDTPAIHIDLIPLLSRVNFHFQFVQVKFSAACFLTGSHFSYAIIVGRAVNKCFAICRRHSHKHLIHNFFSFFLCRVVAHKFTFGHVKQSAICRANQPVIARFYGQGYNSVVDVIEINGNRRYSLLFGCFFLVFCFAFGRISRLIVLYHFHIVFLFKEATAIIVQGHHVYAGSFIVEVGKFETGKIEVKVPVGNKKQVLATGTENG